MGTYTTANAQRVFGPLRLLYYVRRATVLPIYGPLGSKSHSQHVNLLVFGTWGRGWGRSGGLPLTSPVPCSMDQLLGVPFWPGQPRLETQLAARPQGVLGPLPSLNSSSLFRALILFFLCPLSILPRLPPVALASLGRFPPSLVSQTIKNLPAMQETRVQSLGQEDPLELGMATHCGILAWRILWTEEPGGLQSMGWQRV